MQTIALSDTLIKKDRVAAAPYAFVVTSNGANQSLEQLFQARDFTQRAHACMATLTEDACCAECGKQFEI